MPRLAPLRPLSGGSLPAAGRRLAVFATLLATGAVPGPAPAARAQDVLVCDFAGIDPALNAPWTAASFLAPGLAYSGFDLGPGALARGGVNDAFAFTVNSPGGADSTLDQALAADQYLTLTLSATSGSLDLGGKKLAFSIARDSWHAPMRFALLTSVEGFTAGRVLFATPSTGKDDFSTHDWSFIFPLQGYDGLSGPVEIRLYAFEAQWGGHPARVTAWAITQPGPLHSLSLSATGGGTVSTSPGGTLFEQGTVVTLSASPDPGRRLAGWSGDLVGLGNPRRLAMDGDKTVAVAFAPSATGCMEVGTNLDGVTDWSTAWDFVDVFRMARTWMTRSVGGAEWDSGRAAALPADPDGWPLGLPFTDPADSTQHYAHTLMPVPDSGDYTVLLAGSGDLEWWGAIARTPMTLTGGPARFTLTLAAGNLLFLNVLRSDPADPIRAIRVIRPGFEAVADSAPFHPLFLDRLRPFVNLRFMDWGRTNGSPLNSWAERTTPTSYTQTRDQGVALEHMAALANTLGQEPWICIPHAADDDYVRQAARLLGQLVAPGRRIWVEYSNETWNTAAGFGQTTWVQDRGQALGLHPDRWTAGQLFVARRSAEVWRIFAEELGAARVVKVLATQVANSSITGMRLGGLLDPSLNPDQETADVLAIAPYFGRNFTLADLPPNAPAYPTLDQILDLDAPAAIAAVQAWLAEHKQIADRQGWRLVDYEGGQHFVGVAGAEGDDTLTGILHAANRDPRMYDRYRQHLDMLAAEGVEMHSNFTYVGGWSRWGSWGTLEYQDQPLAEAPKYRALGDWIAGHGHDLLRRALPSLGEPRSAHLPLQPARDLHDRVCAPPYRLAGEIDPGRGPLVFYQVPAASLLHATRAGSDVLLDFGF